jgi:hypothetical protein
VRPAFVLQFSTIDNFGTEEERDAQLWTRILKRCRLSPCVPLFFGQRHGQIPLVSDMLLKNHRHQTINPSMHRPTSPRFSLQHAQYPSVQARHVHAHFRQTRIVTTRSSSLYPRQLAYDLHTATQGTPAKARSRLVCFPPHKVDSIGSPAAHCLSRRLRDDVTRRQGQNVLKWFAESLLIPRQAARNVGTLSNPFRRSEKSSH